MPLGEGVVKRLILKLTNMIDVSVSSPTNTQVIAYDSSSGLWTNQDQTGGGGGSGTVTSIGVSTDTGYLTVGSSPVTTSGTITVNGTTGLAANKVLASPDGTTGAVSLRSLVAADVPTLNQNTTGSAATLTTARAIYGNNFDGSAALAQVIASTYGGTGNGFTKFSGATTSEKTYTLPDSNATILYSGGALGTPSGGTLTNCTFPTLNQNTTGSAASLSISGQTGLLTFTGLTSTNRAKTVRNAADTILELGGSYTPTGTWVWTTASVTWPTFNQNTTGSSASCTGNAATVTTNANLTGPVTSSGNATTLVTGIYVAASSTSALGNATLTWVMPFSGTVNTLYAQTTSGTLTWAWKINGTNITGLSAVSVSSTPSTTNATAANTFSAGDTITAVSSSASSDLGASATLKITRT